MGFFYVMKSEYLRKSPNIYFPTSWLSDQSGFISEKHGPATADETVGGHIMTGSLLLPFTMWWCSPFGDSSCGHLL